MSTDQGHPDEAALALYASGDLPRLALWRTARHVRRCRSCRAAADSYVAARDELSQIGAVPEVDFDALAHRIRVAAALDQDRASRRFASGWRIAMATACAGAMVLGFFAVARLGVLAPRAQQDVAQTQAVPDAPAFADAQVTVGGQIEVRAFHAPSGTLTITEYYSP